MRPLLHALTAVFALILSLACEGTPPPAATVENDAEIGVYGIDRISGPFSHENLTLFFLHGADQFEAGSYVTLEQAMAADLVEVHETGNVGELAIDNASDVDVFIQAGDIVRGGQQDRVLTTDLVVPAGAEAMPLASFCVEQGRWSQRGSESRTAFASSENMLATRKLKLAAKSSRNQGAVWQQVEKAQEHLSLALHAPVTDVISSTSLELSLENEQLEARTSSYIQALSELPSQEQQVLGFAFAVGGQLSAIDVYGSADLFARMWPKLLKASAVEALAASTENEAGSAVTAQEVASMLAEARAGTGAGETVSSRVETVRQDTESYHFAETHDLLKRVSLHHSMVSKD